MTPERLEEIEQFATRLGCANCWTGTVGTACVYIRELLAELAIERAGLEVDGNGATV